MDNARDKFHKLALNESFERVARVAKERAEFNRLMALSNGSNPMDNAPRRFNVSLFTRQSGVKRFQFYLEIGSFGFIVSRHGFTLHTALRSCGYIRGSGFWKSA